MKILIMGSRSELIMKWIFGNMGSISIKNMEWKFGIELGINISKNMKWKLDMSN